jgi:hypothetical protein
LSEFTEPAARYDAVVANVVLMGIADYEAAMTSGVAAS